MFICFTGTCFCFDIISFYKIVHEHIANFED
jgi:hypothetical protein